MSLYELGEEAGQIIPLKIIAQDEGVRCLNNEQNELLNKIYAHYADCMIEQVAMWETIHGHMVMLTKQGGRFLPHEKGRAGRFDLEDMQVLMAPGIRWVEFGTDTLKVGL